MANVDSRSHEARSIEPLSDAAWSRVEAGLFARLDRGEHLAPADPFVESAPASTRRRTRPASRRWGFVLALAAAAAAVAVWVQTNEPPSRSQPMARVESRAPGAAPAPTGAPARVAEAAGHLAGGAQRALGGALLASGAESKRWLVGDSEVTLDPDTELAVAGSDAVGYRLTLERGRVDCQVAPRGGRPPFVVAAGEATVTVVGTHFSVSRELSGARVQVEHGSVRVSTPTTSVLLGAGESWPAPEVAPVGDASPAAMATDVPPPARSSPVRRGADAAARFDRATRLEATSPDAALRIYRELSRRPGPWAPNALYAAGRLEIERHRTQRGRTLLERYLKRYPEGANAADARELLERR